MITLEAADPAVVDRAAPVHSAAAETPGERFRVELFSDAVFAVAITVLVLGLPLTTASGSVLDVLGSRWASFAAFGISFAIIGCLWVSHWRLFHLLRHCDETIALVNLALLLFVVLIPFGASTMATFLSRGGGQAKLAAALFAAILLAMGLCFAILAVLVRRRAGNRMLPGWRPQIVQVAGVAGYAIAIGTAFAAPISVVVITGAVAAYYIAQEVAGCRQRAVGRDR